MSARNELKKQLLAACDDMHGLISSAFRLLVSWLAIHSALAQSQDHQESAEDLTNLAVSNSPFYLVAERVGTKGLPEYDPKRSYSIVIHPTIDVGKNAVYVPEDIQDAVKELKTALPEPYKKELRLAVVHDQNNEPWLTCKTESRSLDQDVLNWMVVYWQLREEDSPLPRFYRSHISSTAHAEGIASSVLIYFCQSDAR